MFLGSDRFVISSNRNRCSSWNDVYWLSRIESNSITIAMLPDSPHDTGHLIGNRNGGLVMPPASVNVHCPGGELIRFRFRLCGPKHRAGSMGQ